MTANPTRFYKDAVAEPLKTETGETAYGVFLDRKPLKSPGGKPLMLPRHALAEAIAEEWRAQGAKLNLRSMALTRLANIAFDRAAANRAETAGRVLAFGKSDLLCYRAEAPAGLRARQMARWDPLLSWFEARHGAALNIAVGIAFVAQPDAVLAALERHLSVQDAFMLTGLSEAAGLTGSAVLALALADGHIGAEEAFALAQLDEEFQAERWGRDEEAEATALSRKTELAVLERYFRILRER